MALTQEEILALLKAPERPVPSKTSTATYPPNIQSGPLRWFDTSMRCADKGCTSPTYFKVEGIPRCMIHALRKLNEMLVAQEPIEDWLNA